MVHVGGVDAVGQGVANNCAQFFAAAVSKGDGVGNRVAGQGRIVGQLDRLGNRQTGWRIGNRCGCKDRAGLTTAADVVVAGGVGNGGVIRRVEGHAGADSKSQSLMG